MNQQQLISAQRHQNPRQLVENRVCFSGPESQLSIYDTYLPATRVGLAASDLMYCGMISGKKVMYSHSDPMRAPEKNTVGRVFLPHESFVIPAGGQVEIDFPEASAERPTTCLTIELAADKVETLSQKMADITKLGDLDHDWEYEPRSLHTAHDQDTQNLLLRLSRLFVQDNSDRELLIELATSELIIRLLRQQGTALLLNHSKEEPDASGVSAAISLIQKNFLKPLEIDQLCQLACMSRSKLYSEFKKQLGCSPGEFQQKLRLESAASFIRDGHSITQSCFNVGFKDLSHFNRRFSKQFGCSPRSYQQRFIKTY